MFSLLFLTLLYFLPAILGRDKSDATGIFLLNLFLGWTLIGWVAALIWAISSDRPNYVRYVPLSHGRFCCQCGSLAHPGAHFCVGCGRTVQTYEAGKQAGALQTLQSCNQCDNVSYHFSSFRQNFATVKEIAAPPKSAPRVCMQKDCRQNFRHDRVRAKV